MKPPSHIAQARIVGAPIDYAWDQHIALRHFAGRDQNLRLYTAVNRANLHAAHLIGCGVAEWIIWRYEGLTPIDDALLRLQAAYAANIEPGCFRDLNYDFDEMPGYSSDDPIGSPLALTLEALGRLCGRLESGYIYVAELTVNLAMLARRVLPGPAAFDAWLQAVIARLAEAYPRRVEYDRESEYFDASTEPALPRDFLDPAAALTSDARLSAIAAFRSTLRPEANPYLDPDVARGRAPG